MAKKRKTLTAERIFDLATIDPVAREGWVVAADSVESRHCVHAPHSELGEQLGLSDSRMVILSHLKVGRSHEATEYSQSRSNDITPLYTVCDR